MTNRAAPARDRAAQVPVGSDKAWSKLAILLLLIVPGLLTFLPGFEPTRD